MHLASPPKLQMRIAQVSAKKMKYRHHYIPQFYLRKFSQNGKHVIQTDKRTGTHHVVAIKTTAQIRDFYAYDAPWINDREVVEKELSKYESKFSQLLDFIFTHGAQGEKARAELCKFTIISHLRVPKFFNKIQILLDEYDKNFPESFNGKIHWGDQSAKVGIMMEMLSLPASYQILNKMNIALLKAPFGSAFLTSDAPVCLYHPEYDNANQSPGFLTGGVEITFPLSRYFAVKFTQGNSGYIFSHATNEEVDEINNRSILSASQFIYSSSQLNLFE